MTDKPDKTCGKQHPVIEGLVCVLPARHAGWHTDNPGRKGRTDWSKKAKPA